MSQFRSDNEFWIIEALWHLVSNNWITGTKTVQWHILKPSLRPALSIFFLFSRHQRHHQSYGVRSHYLTSSLVIKTTVVTHFTHFLSYVSWKWAEWLFLSNNWSKAKGIFIEQAEHLSIPRLKLMFLICNIVFIMD